MTVTHSNVKMVGENCYNVDLIAYYENGEKSVHRQKFYTNNLRKALYALKKIHTVFIEDLPITILFEK